MEKRFQGLLEVFSLRNREEVEGDEEVEEEKEDKEVEGGKGKEGVLG